MPIPPREAYRWTSDVMSSLRAALEELDFDEILPAILSDRYEPGARHAIAVLGDRALPSVVTAPGADPSEQVTVTGSQHYYLPVSHCVEKQFALEHADRVYCIAPCVRLLMDGEEFTGRHLYTFFQAEIEWHTSLVEEVYTVIEALLAHFSKELLARRGPVSRETAERIEMLGRVPYERLTFAQARQRVRDVGGSENPHASGDLTHAEEHALCADLRGPLWLTDYPDGVRDSTYRRQPDGLFATYDLMLPGGYGELATGGLRPDSGADARRQAARFGQQVHPMYAQWKDRTGIQTGGIGIGVERLIRFCAGADSVLDLRLAHDQGPNDHISS